VNRKWRRSDQRGFRLDTKTGYWAKRSGDDDRAGDIDETRMLSGVLPFVRDTRNILLIRLGADIGAAKEDREAFLASLSFAFQRGMQIYFQVEEQEIAVNRIGEGDARSILFWEASEGGSGIWLRLMEDPDAVARVVAEALTTCHFDPETGEDRAEKDACAKACYRCLLSYTNQPDHRQLDRFLIRDYLLQLRRASTKRTTGGRSYEDQYQWLLERRDPSSSLEAKFLTELFGSRRRLPDRAQYRPEPSVYAEADFFYERDALKGVAVFIDGTPHDEPARKEQDQRERKKLEDLGYRVIVIRYDKPLAEQINAHADVFGPGL
jgi:very-short-patch-repair endonuclease